MTTKRRNRSEKSAALQYLEKLTGGPLTIARMLKSLRKCDEITQQDYAKLLGISRQNLCDIEKGRKFVSPARAALFAEKLGYPPAFFVEMALQEDLARVGSRAKIKVIDAA